MITKKSWKEFKETGLLLYINQVLHVFGWAIVFEQDEDSNVIKCYPARVKFRGFDNSKVRESYTKISKFMNKNSEELLEESES